MMQAMSNATAIHDIIMRAQLTKYNGELDRSKWLMPDVKVSSCQDGRLLLLAVQVTRSPQKEMPLLW